ncbi:MAG: DHH family phosphoesterase [Thermoplasmatota archaeon]
MLWMIIKDIMDMREGGVLVLAHHNADLDAVATAIVLKRAFPWVDIGAFKSISQPGRNLLDTIGEEMTIDPDTASYSLVIVVDSSSPLQVTDGDPSDWKRFWVIDHHEDHGHWNGGLYVDSSSGSCVQIAVQMALLTGCPIDRDMAVSAIAGIIADTGKFRFARGNDMLVLVSMMDSSGISMEEVLGIIEGENYFDISKKIAQLKALKRVKYTKVGDQVIASSVVSSYEAASARVLLVAGGDVVFVGAQKKGEIRISTRAKPHILLRGVHLGKFMEMIGKETGNQGGGHDGAAGLNGSGDVERILTLCARRMAERLRTEDRPASS